MVAFGGTPRTEKRRLIRRASGRRYCKRPVGMNFNPNRLPPLSARVDAPIEVERGEHLLVERQADQRVELHLVDGHVQGDRHRRRDQQPERPCRAGFDVGQAQPPRMRPGPVSGTASTPSGRAAGTSVALRSSSRRRSVNQPVHASDGRRWPPPVPLPPTRGSRSRASRTGTRARGFVGTARSRTPTRSRRPPARERHPHSSASW